MKTEADIVIFEHLIESGPGGLPLTIKPADTPFSMPNKGTPIRAMSESEIDIAANSFADHIENIRADNK